MLEIGICDDEKIFRSDLRKMIETDLELCGLDFSITEFSSGEELLSRWPKPKPRILFLDIEMKNLNGLETARSLRNFPDSPLIIFVTSHPDFVFQGYEVRAFHYIMKPYQKNKILSVLHEAIKELPALEEACFTICQQGTSRRLPYAQISYFMSDRRMVIAVTQEQSYPFYGKLSELEQILPPAFIRIHNRYCVNLKFVSKLDPTHSCILCGGQELPVSRTYKQQLSIAFAKYMLE